MRGAERPPGRVRGPRIDHCTKEEWIAARVIKADAGFASPCWLWDRYLTSEGYGETTIAETGRDIHYRAHRLAYEILVGPIPTGFEIDHLCRKRACCNPAHLEAVPPEENVRRAIPFVTAAARKRAGQFCRRGHLREGDNVRFNKRGARRCHPCTLENDRQSDRRRRAKARAER